MAVKLNKGTQLLISGASGADYAWSVEGITSGSGRVSAQIDLGSLPRCGEYEWSCEVQFQATPTQGKGLALYRAAAPDSMPRRSTAIPARAMRRWATWTCCAT